MPRNVLKALPTSWQLWPLAGFSSPSWSSLDTWAYIFESHQESFVGSANSELELPDAIRDCVSRGRGLQKDPWNGYTIYQSMKRNKISFPCVQLHLCQAAVVCVLGSDCLCIRQQLLSVSMCLAVAAVCVSGCSCPCVCCSCPCVPAQVELHRHMDGCVRRQTAWQLAQ